MIYSDVLRVLQKFTKKNSWCCINLDKYVNDLHLCSCQNYTIYKNENKNYMNVFDIILGILDKKKLFNQIINRDSIFQVSYRLNAKKKVIGCIAVFSFLLHIVLIMIFWFLVVNIVIEIDFCKDIHQQNFYDDCLNYMLNSYIKKLLVKLWVVEFLRF